MNKITAKTATGRQNQTKVPISIRLDPEVIDGFVSGGPGWMTRMNAVLADWVRTNRPQSTTGNPKPTNEKPG